MSKYIPPVGRGGKMKSLTGPITVDIKLGAADKIRFWTSEGVLVSEMKMETAFYAPNVLKALKLMLEAFEKAGFTEIAPESKRFENTMRELIKRAGGDTEERKR